MACGDEGVPKIIAACSFFSLIVNSLSLDVIVTNFKKLMGVASLHALKLSVDIFWFANYPIEKWI